MINLCQEYDYFVSQYLSDTLVTSEMYHCWCDVL